MTECIAPAWWWLPLADHQRCCCCRMTLGDPRTEVGGFDGGGVYYCRGCADAVDAERAA